MAADTPFSPEGRTTAERTRDRARERSNDTRGRVQEQASETADRARQKATENLSHQKERATSQLDSVTSALHTTSDSLRDQQQDSIASIVDSAADQVERLSSYVRSRSVGELMDDVQDVARREPALFIGGAAMLGIIGARFLKSSQRQRYEGDYNPDYDYERRTMYRHDDFLEAERTRRRTADADFQPPSSDTW